MCRNEELNIACMDGLTSGDPDIYRLDDESSTLPLRVTLGTLVHNHESNHSHWGTLLRHTVTNWILLDILSVVPLVQIPLGHDNPSDHYIQR